VIEAPTASNQARLEGFKWVNGINQDDLYHKEQFPSPSMMTVSLITPHTLRPRHEKWQMSTTPLLEEYKMGNRLFQEARKFVNIAKNASADEKEAAINRAKNALASAYANSNFAEQEQLRQFQNELDQLK
jgi:hypothetical protein